MATLQEYLSHVLNCVTKKDAHQLATLLLLHTPGYTLDEDHISESSLAELVTASSIGPRTWKKFLKLHLTIVKSYKNSDYKTAFKDQNQLLINVMSYIRKNKEYWNIPILISLCRNVRTISENTDKSNLSWRRERLISGSDRYVEEAANKLHNVCFNPMLQIALYEDDQAYSGVLAAANQLLRMYEKIGYVDQYRNIIDSMRELLGDPSKSRSCSKTQLVTFNYFAGRYFYSQCEFHLAHICFRYACRNCPQQYEWNRAKCLRYVVLSKLALGHLPMNSLLQKANMLELVDIVYAIKSGHIGVFDKALDIHRVKFIHWDAYLMLIKLKVLVYRSLFKRVYTLMQEHGKIIPVSYFATALAMCGEGEHTLNSVECLLEMLITGGYIKGYISHTHRKIVFSKETPFVPVPINQKL